MLAITTVIVDYIVKMCF